MKNNITLTNGVDKKTFLKLSMFALVFATVVVSGSSVYAEDAAGVVTGKFSSFQMLYQEIFYQQYQQYYRMIQSLPEYAFVCQ